MTQFVHFSRMSEQENNEQETASVKGLKFFIRFIENEIFEESFGNNFFHVYKEKDQF